MQDNHKGPYKREARGSESEGDVITKAEMRQKDRERWRFEDAAMLALKMEEGDTSPGME